VARAAPVRLKAWVVEVGFGGREAFTPSDDLDTSLELLEAHIHASLREEGQRTFEPLSDDQHPQVTRLAACCVQQAAIRTGRVAVDQSLGEAEKALLPRRKQGC
jgi:hypothetical protein